MPVIYPHVSNLYYCNLKEGRSVPGLNTYTARFSLTNLTLNSILNGNKQFEIELLKHTEKTRCFGKVSWTLKPIESPQDGRG